MAEKGCSVALVAVVVVVLADAESRGGGGGGMVLGEFNLACLAWTAAAAARALA